ncbi:putative ribonuclease H protein [Corchorus olitorius]|uniref:Ribonuclease H protein n=1 Tax=Corchorus olitorius TaxID=93759 RepID=A0A1R3J2Y5_9ROSI|nr:putative ribonuclease H protein [Corchorus olitorius]
MLALKAAIEQFIDYCVELKLNMETTPVVFSLDCQNLVNILNGVGKLPRKVAQIPLCSQLVGDLNNLMSSLPKCRIIHEVREVNEAANFLATNVLPTVAVTCEDKRVLEAFKKIIENDRA